MAIPQGLSPKTAAIISRPDRPEVAKILPGLLAWLGDHGYRVIIDLETPKYTAGPEAGNGFGGGGSCGRPGGGRKRFVRSTNYGRPRCSAARCQPGIAGVLNGS